MLSPGFIRAAAGFKPTLDGETGACSEPASGNL
jgi:hypothetical protein